MEKLNLSDNVKLTSWNNEPSVNDLESDLLSAESIHNTHVANTEQWLNKLRN